MFRRKFLMATALGCAVVLTGCGQTTAQIAATLENAQAEATAIFAAVQSFVPANASADISTALSLANMGIADLLSVTPGESGAEVALAVVKDISPLLGMLPIPPVTLATIQAGLGLITAFGEGVAAVAAPAPTAAVGAVPMRTIAAPIPILLPVA